MKKIVAIAIAVLVTAGAVGAPAFAAPAAKAPVVFYSDLTSGPNTGGKDNNGVFVTVAGRNFGPSKGESSVSVGGGEAVEYAVWSDRKITFQLGPGAKTGPITVTTPGGASNGVPFTVRPGRIFFVDANAPGNAGSGSYEDPWKSPESFFAAQQPGDTCYFRAGTYSGKYGNKGRSYNVSLDSPGVPSGARDNEIAWVGYPGETALFKADDNATKNGAFELTGNKQYYIIAGLSIYGRGDGREQVRMYSDNNKLVNCKVEGIKTLSYAMVGVTASNLQIWGNEFYGATSRNKLDHIIYFQSGGQSNNVDIGWNYIHDNDIGPGPVFSWNLSGGTSNGIVIHDNIIDCRNSSDVLRLAGIWNGSDGSITFANNVVIGAGGSLNDQSYNAIYAGFGKITIHNNTFYRSKGAGSNAVVNIYGSASADVKNNIFSHQDNIGYVEGNARVDSNLYHGGTGSPPAGDARPVSGDPQFVNPEALDFHIKPESPAKGKGAEVCAAARKDFDGVPRAAGDIAVGAFQLYEGGPLPIGTDYGDGSSGSTGGTLTIPGTDATVPSGEVKVVGGTQSRGTVNPARGESVKIYFQGDGVGTFECRVFTLAGDMVWDSSLRNIQGGVFEWKPDAVASGIYLANVRGPGLKATKKIAILQ